MLLPTYKIVEDTGLRVTFGLQVIFGYLDPGGGISTLSQIFFLRNFAFEVRAFYWRKVDCIS